MEITETYQTLEDAKVGIKSHESLGHQVLHENHYYEKDVLNYAELVIETTPNTKPLPVPPASSDLAAEITQLKSDMANLDTRLRRDISGHVR